MTKSVMLMTFCNGFPINHFSIMLEKIVFTLGRILANVFKGNLCHFPAK